MPPPPAGTQLLSPLPRTGPGQLLPGEGPRPSRGRGRAAEPRPGGGPCPSYLLSRQAIHSAEEEEWAACAATMLGSGARSPWLRRPPALALPLPPPRPRRGPAPPGPPRDRRGGDGPALPAGSRGLPGGGPAREGTRGAGRGDREGPSRLPARRCTAEPGGGGSPAVPPAAGRGRGATLRGWSPVTGGRHLSGRRGPRPSPPDLRSVDRGKAPRVGRGLGVAVSVYIFHTANATKMAAACFLRNPLVFLSGCQNLLAVSCSPFPFPL